MSHRVAGNPRASLIGVGALAAGSLWLEIALLRFLSVAQHYHFAFLIVSLALLGFGASGSILTLLPGLKNRPLERSLPTIGGGFFALVLVAYGTVNGVPFDSYSIAWDSRQVLYFILYFGVLAGPFLLAGLGIGLSLATAGEKSHIVYAANLFGSGLGALLAPLAVDLVGVPGAVLGASLFGLAPAILGRRRWLVLPAFGAGALLLVWFGLENQSGASPLRMSISPYKGLAHALARPGTVQTYGAWSSRSRVDVLRDAGNRQLPGLSLTYPALPPEQMGIALDGGGLQPITLISPERFEAAVYLPEAVVFALRPGAKVLALEPAGGLGVLQALAGGADSVTAVLADAGARRAIAASTPDFDVYAHPQVHLAASTPREFLAQGPEPTFSVIYLPLTEGYQPVENGAYSLGEDYTRTREGLEAMLERLAPGGLLVSSRWLQSQPSETIRLVALAVEALEERGNRASDSLVLYRSLQTATLVVNPDGWRQEELAQIRRFLEDRRFDLVWAPDVVSDEVNRYNRMPEPLHYLAVRDLLQSANREAFYRTYPFDIRPPTDDHPFFAHYFRWGQTPEVLSQLGKAWLPFGGSGYLLLVALLVLAAGLSLLLILGPLLFVSRKHPEPGSGLRWPWVWAYFGALGAGFLLVEIPLIQRWILLVGSPVAAFSLVVFALLTFSSLGSGLSARFTGRRLMGVLALAAVATPWLTGALVEGALGWPPAIRVVLGLILLAPLGVLMGLPFPLGLARVQAGAPSLVPWAWAVNGFLSVVSSVLAAILALAGGFTLVLLAGAGCYIAAWILLLVGAPAGKREIRPGVSSTG